MNCTHFGKGIWHDRTAQQIALAVDRLLNRKELTIQDAEVVTDPQHESSEMVGARDWTW